MPYCTTSDITKRIPEETLIQLTDDDDLGVIGQDVVDGAIADSDELIDGYLRGRYVLPLSPEPGIIKAISVNLTVYDLYGRRPAFAVPDDVKERHKVQIKVLEQIQTGRISLGTAAIPAQAEAASGGKIVTPERIFSKEVLDAY
jgi:phage gp36-like protein